MNTLTQLKNLLTVLHKHFHTPQNPDGVAPTPPNMYTRPFDYITNNGNIALTPDPKNSTTHITYIWADTENPTTNTWQITDRKEARCNPHQPLTNTPHITPLDNSNPNLPPLCPQCETLIQEEDLENVTPDNVDDVLTQATTWIKTSSPPSTYPRH